MRSEVLIIGGGVIGLSIARELVKNGLRDVAIVERGAFGQEASWAAAGMLAPNIETDCDPIFHRFGIEGLRMYPAFAESLLEETGIDIELDRSGTFCLAFDEREASELASTYRQQIDRGVGVEIIDGGSLNSAEPNIASTVTSALFYPNDWQVKNRKMISALEAFARSSDVRMLANTEVRELNIDGARVTGATTSTGVFDAAVTIVATGAWTSLIKIGGAAMPFDVKPIRGQMISYRPDGPLLRHVVYSERGYLVPRADGRLLVGATVEEAGFEKANTDEAIVELKAAAEEIVPSVTSLQVADTWSGLRPFAPDALPIIGSLPGYENVFVATAHYRNGILLGPITAKIIAERVVHGTESEYFRRFGADRFSDASFGLGA